MLYFILSISTILFVASSKKKKNGAVRSVWCVCARAEEWYKI